MIVYVWIYVCEREKEGEHLCVGEGGTDCVYIHVCESTYTYIFVHNVSIYTDRRSSFKVQHLCVSKLTNIEECKNT